MRAVFCGACNPVFDMKALFASVKRAFPSSPSGLLLLLNGCQVGCLKPVNFPEYEKIVCVSGTSVDGWEVPENELTAAVIDAIDAILN